MFPNLQRFYISHMYRNIQLFFIINITFVMHVCCYKIIDSERLCFVDEKSYQFAFLCVSKSVFAEMGGFWNCPIRYPLISQQHSDGVVHNVTSITLWEMVCCLYSVLPVNWARCLGGRNGAGRNSTRFSGPSGYGKMHTAAEDIRVKGWKWVETALSFPRGPTQQPAASAFYGRPVWWGAPWVRAGCHSHEHL